MAAERRENESDSQVDERKENGISVSSSLQETGSQDIPPPAMSLYQKIYKFFGFSTAYNFNLWVIFGGAMFGFSLSRLHYFNIEGIFAKNMNPGYWYVFHKGSYRVGIVMHIVTCLPGGLLMVLQFIPSIRYKYTMLHRINGYIVMLLMFFSNLGACILVRHIDNGRRMGAQTCEGFLVIITTVAMGLAYYNIKRLQIDQHRSWMIRAMVYFGAIITSRILCSVGVFVVDHIGGYYSVWSCDEIDFTYKQFGVEGILEKKYPQCLIPNGTTDGRVVVKALYSLTDIESVGANSNLNFDYALWLSTVLHIIGAEIYLSLTPRESKRLRQVSYERQLKAGFKNPGFSGTTVNQWGDDEPWVPKTD